MKFFFSLIVFTALIAFTAKPASARRHHRGHVAARTDLLGACSELPKTCSDSSDNFLECVATTQGQRFEEGARDSDNIDCIKMRLWKKICAKDLESNQVKANCH